MNVLSLQSQVTYGCVGNNAATFPLQRLGIGVMAIPTVLFSNHPGYQTHQGVCIQPETIAAHMQGVRDMDLFGQIDCLLSGYLGSVETARFLHENLPDLKTAHPDFFYFCDPVLGDDKTGLYVSEDLAVFVRETLITQAEFLAPNLFELEYLSGRPQNNLNDCLLACDLLRARGPKNILVSSFPETIEDKPYLANLIVSDHGAWKVSVAHLPLRAKGTGDCLSALYLAHVLRGETAESALELATASLYGIISETVRFDGEELRLIDAQAEFLNPSFYFDCQRIG